MSANNKRWLPTIFPVEPPPANPGGFVPSPASRGGSLIECADSPSLSTGWGAGGGVVLRYGALPIIVTVIILSLLLPLVVLAQDGGEIREVTADEVNEVSSKLYCPVCENIPLDVCGTAACARWREQVRTLLEEGNSEEEVINYFVEQFGERVVGTPQDPLLNFLAWVVPLGAVVIGIAMVGIVLVRWRGGRGRGENNQEPSDELNGDDDYRDRLERDLRDFE